MNARLTLMFHGWCRNANAPDRDDLERLWEGATLCASTFIGTQHQYFKHHLMMALEMSYLPLVLISIFPKSTIMLGGFKLQVQKVQRDAA